MINLVRTEASLGEYGIQMVMHRGIGGVAGHHQPSDAPTALRSLGRELLGRHALKAYNLCSLFQKLSPSLVKLTLVLVLSMYTYIPFLAKKIQFFSFFFQNHLEVNGKASKFCS